jgi:hypothetical protein
MNKIGVGIAVGGFLILLIGVSLMLKAGVSADNIYIEPEDKAVWSGNSTENEVLPFQPEEDSSEYFEIYAKLDATVDGLKVVDHSGRDILSTEVYCAVARPNDAEECQSEWVIIAEFETYSCPCEISFNSSDDLLIVPQGAAGPKNLVEEYTANLCGGAMACLLGLLILATGGGITLFSRKKVALQIQQNAMNQFPQTGMQQTINDPSIYSK